MKNEHISLHIGLILSATTFHTNQTEAHPIPRFNLLVFKQVIIGNENPLLKNLWFKYSEQHFIRVTCLIA